jgi:DNA-binding HxlR family transcriptional regulator
MVLEIKGYDPTEVGLRKFLTTQETEVLGCLWDLGKDGGNSKAIKGRLDEMDCRHSLATITKTLKGLKERGIVESKVIARSAPQNVYYALVDRERLPAMLVGELVSTLNKAMPEAMAYAVKKLKP